MSSRLFIVKITTIDDGVFEFTFDYKTEQSSSASQEHVVQQMPGYLQRIIEDSRDLIKKIEVVPKEMFEDNPPQS